MKQAFLAIIFTSVGLSLMAQENSEVSSTNRYTPSPDFPGALVFDWGINYFKENSAIMDTKPWSSPTINVYYMYPFNLNSSRVSFIVGVGIGSEKNTFKSSVTFVDFQKITTVKAISEVPYFENTGRVKKSQVITNYFDIPVEFRIHSRKNDHMRSFYLALGGKIGFCFANKTKIVYSEFDTTKKYKNLYHYNVNSVRYGVSARLGYGPFNLWGYYGLNQFFKSNSTVDIKNPNTFSFGISLTTF